MKYIIETTKEGCKETLLIQDEIIGEIEIVRNHERTMHGCKSDEEFNEKLEEYGYCEEILEQVEDCLDGFFPLNFMELAEELED